MVAIIECPAEVTSSLTKDASFSEGLTIIGRAEWEPEVYRELAREMLKVTRQDLRRGLARMQSILDNSTPDCWTNERMDDTYYAVTSAIAWLDTCSFQETMAMFGLDNPDIARKVFLAMAGLTDAGLVRLKNAALKLGLRWRMRYTLTRHYRYWLLSYDDMLDTLYLQTAPPSPAIWHDVEGQFYLGYQVSRKPGRLVGVMIENFDLAFLPARPGLAEKWVEAKPLLGAGYWGGGGTGPVADFRAALLKALLAEMR